MSTTTHETKSGRLTLDDLRTFDNDATQLVQEMQEAGWTGYMTSRGHAFMRAPDGTTTASVSRDSLRGRSGRNARAQLTRWQRQQREAVAQGAGSSFGEINLDEPGVPTWDGTRPLPTGTLAEVKRSGPFQEFLRARNRSGPISDLVFVVPDDLPSKVWAAFEVHGKGNVRLIAHGSQMPEDQAWALLWEQRPGLHEPAAEPATADTHTSGGQDMKVYVCKECNDQFTSVPMLAAHAHSAHSKRTWTCQECGKEFGHAGGLNLHKNGAHPTPVTCDEPGCGYVTVNKGALARHGVINHGRLTAKAQKAKDKAGDLTVTHTTPRPAPVPAPAPALAVPAQEASGDVLMDYLLTTPSGEDAEELVARVRAVVAAPLVGELRRLREENAMLTEQNAKLANDNGDLEAKLSILREALSI